MQFRLTGARIISFNRCWKGICAKIIEGWGYVNFERKRQVLELTDTLKEALQYLNTPAGSSAVYLIEDCLACISVISNQLEKVYDNHYLTLCDACSFEVKKGSYGAAYTQVDLLSAWIDEHVDAKYEIVFMPYKAEMWDALDSVWRAACADSRCVVRTVPIPYQSLNPESNALSEEYDGERFPSYVEITHYKDYDLSLHNPDTIFIHNPYDAYNRVTRVHPEYFSSNLIRYTDKLVYIPYYVSLGGLNSSLPGLPSARNSWKIFVESETTRQDYLRFGKLDPNRVVALGTPKLDYMEERMREGIQIPSEWKAALQGRKVFFYNTSIGKLLSDNEHAVQYMREIFHFFRENQDIAIIWRPHPLNINTLNAMLPHVLESYLQLIEDFKNLPNAVYDESQEMHTAILCSDAYIGDTSSVLVPYSYTGKPILTLLAHQYRFNPDAWGISPAWYEFDEEPNIPISISPGVIRNGVLLSPGINRGGAFSLDLATGCFTLTSHIPAELYREPQLFVTSVVYKDTLWFVPARASKVMNYHYRSGEIKEFSFPSIGDRQRKPITKAVQHNEYLWMLSAHSSTVVRLHLETGEMWELEISPSDIRNRHQIPGFTDGVIHNNQLWVALSDYSSLVRLDLASHEATHYELDFLQTPVRGIVSDDVSLWLIMDTSPYLVQWFPYTNETKIHNKFPADFDGGTQPFTGALFDGNEIWLIPHDANMIVKVSVGTGEKSVSYTNLKKSEWAMLNPWYPFDSLREPGLNVDHTLFSGAVLHEDWVWFSPVAAPSMLGIHRVTGEIREIPLGIPREIDEKAFIISRFPQPYPKGGLDQRSFFNNRNFPFKHFINMVRKSNLNDWSEKQRKEVRASIANADGTCGAKIWDYVAGHLSS